MNKNRGSFSVARHQLWGVGVVLGALLSTPIAASAQPHDFEDAEQLYAMDLELYKAGRFAEGIPLAQEALAITKQIRGSQHPETAHSLNILAMHYYETGAYQQAQPLFEEALAIMKKVLGSRHLDTATMLNNLAKLYRATGAYGQAQSLLEEALAIRKQVLGPRHPDTVTSLNNLAVVYKVTGAYVQAHSLLEEVLAITKETLGPRHFDTARSLNNLAQLYTTIGACALAKPLYEEALAIRKQVLGPRHPDTVLSLGSLASNYYCTGAYGRAQTLLEEALAMGKQIHGPQHPATAITLSDLALVNHATGAHGQAQSLLEEALAIQEQVLGPQHPEKARTHSNLAILAWGQEEWADALQHLHSAADIEETNLRSLLAVGDESRKRAYMDMLKTSTAAAVSFVVAAASHAPAATSLGLEVVLQRKGRVMDVLAESFSRIRASASPEDQTLWAQYVATQTDWATLTMSGPGPLSVAQYRERLAELEQQVEALVKKMSDRSGQFRAVLEPVTMAQVQQALPPHAVLIEWIQYRPFSPKTVKKELAWGISRYAAYVLKSSGDPVLVDVGEAEAIETKVSDLLAALRHPGGSPTLLAQELDQLLLQPLRSYIGSVDQLFISPDGQLNLLPFGVLQDASGQYLADQYDVTYLTSGRDLLRPAPPAEASRPSLLVADPDFDATAPAPHTTTTSTSTRRSADMDRSGIRFKRLEGTVKEAEDLGPLLKLAPSQVLTKARATEGAVKQAQSPRILHIATHGFFLPNLPETFNATSRGAAMDLDQPLPAPSGENPLLRSGLVLAGANQRRSGNDDGVLTALEVSSFDLTGTQLAVLSACETAVGDVQNGEGVYGLRRALVLAGVRTQVVSLWKVDDTATQVFMGHYYRYVLDGIGRSAALRLTQQDMRKNPKKPEWADPYYWAAFVAIGDASPLPNERLSSATKKRK